MAQVDYDAFKLRTNSQPIINGMWQVSGAHGTINPQQAVKEMLDYHEAGFTTWDLADHYGPAEDLMGEFRRQLATRHGEAELGKVRAFTKWVPRPAKTTRTIVENAINISLKRMGVTTIDLLQFHWWEYNNPAYLDALQFLVDLQQTGRIRHLALTNFDTKHLEIIVNKGIPIISNQVQYSLVDQRPAAKMVAFCQQHNIQLLTYGTLCGGLMTEKYLNQAEPPGKAQLNTASLKKYIQMIETWGGWQLFQQLLQTLHTIGQRHGVSLSNVATRAILDQPVVAGVILGTHLSITSHLAANSKVLDLHLTPTDLAEIAAITSQGRDLLAKIGDCGDEYR